MRVFLRHDGERNRVVSVERVNEWDLFFGEFGMGNWDAWMRMRIVFGIFFRLETWIEN
jgi:hypothetical protein